MKRIIFELFMEQAPRVWKSVSSAYKKVIDQAGQKAQSAGSGGAGAGKQAMDDIKQKMGTFVNPMTQDHALEILMIDPQEHAKLRLEKYREENPDCKDESVEFSGFDHENIMDRFDTLSEKNSVERGGSFYIRSKIYFAKEFLMQDFPEDLNVSKYNPDAVQEEEPAEEKKDDKNEKK